MADYSLPVILNDYHKRNYRYATTYSRFLATLIDYVIIVLLAFFSFLGVSALFKNTEAANTAYHSWHDVYLQTHLYYEKEDGTVDLITYDNYLDYEKNVYLFYSDYLGEKCPVPEKDKYDVYWYNVFIYGQKDGLNKYTSEELTNRSNLVKIDGAAYFEYQKDKDGNPIYDSFAKLKTDVTDKIARNYYDVFNDKGERQATASIYSLSVQTLVKKDWFTQRYNNYANLVSFYPALISLGIMALVFKYIIPLCNKRRQTIGKMITHIALIDMDANKVSWARLSLRFFPSYLIFIAIYCLTNFFYGGKFGALLIIGILLLISFLTVLTTNKHRALHDILPKVNVISLNASLIDNKDKK